MRIVRLDWRIGELERRTLGVLLDTVADELRRLRLGEVTRRSDLTERLKGAEWRELVHDSAHHMGTARMSDDPNRGVVDRNCRAHFVRNLYVGSMAVFPTSARSSPTLTAIALSIRIADHIKVDLSRPTVISE
jgi:choline dehydrogenase-like flavoprotein